MEKFSCFNTSTNSTKKIICESRDLLLGIIATKFDINDMNDWILKEFDVDTDSFIDVDDVNEIESKRL